MYLSLTKMGWATFWAIISQTNLVTLVGSFLPKAIFCETGFDLETLLQKKNGN
jgi:hypothetical protein